MIALLLLGCFSTTITALPLYYNETTICAAENGDLCTNPELDYERIIPAQPGYQWNDAGGYCGAWSMQRATLTQGAWISQQQVRDHAVPGGGHDNEILSTNIVAALKNLHIDFNAFDYTQAIPQQNAYAKWIKEQLVAGYAVAWMILWDGQAYPIYNLKPPAGMYGHVEPVIGIQSNHPLNDTKVYDDDTVVHFTDGGVQNVYRKLSTLGGQWDGPGHRASCGRYSYCMASYAFGWSFKGFTDDKKSMPANLAVEPWKSEPDVRAGKKGEPLKGTLTVTELEVGSKYDIYRWDSVKSAFTYSDTYLKTTFTAKKETYVYEDDKSFISSGSTYYKCVPSTK